MIHITWGGLGNDQGELIIEGTPIYNFAIGGQELWIDHICELGMKMDNTLPDDCFTFDNLGSSALTVGDVFYDRDVDKGFEFEIVSYMDAAGSPSASASAMPLSEADNQVDMGGALQLNSSGLKVTPLVSGARPLLPTGISVMFREGISQGGADATGGAYLEVNGVGVHVEI